MLMVAIGHQAGLAIENTLFYNDKIQAERLAAVGQTIATLSHHIKNILQGIRSGSYLIDLGLNEKDESIVRRGWTIVEKNQTRIYNLVMDMLSFSKDREPALEPADLNETVGEVIELMQPAPRSWACGWSGSPASNLSRVLIDPEGIHRARAEHRHQRHRRHRGLAGREGRRPDRVGRRRGDGPDRRRRQRPGHRRGRHPLDLPDLRLDQGLQRHRAGPARLAEDHPRARRPDRRPVPRSARERRFIIELPMSREPRLPDRGRRADDDRLSRRRGSSHHAHASAQDRPSLAAWVG